MRCRVRSLARGECGSSTDRQGRKGGAVVCSVCALEWLEAEVEPVPGPVGALRLPQSPERASRRLAGLAPMLLGVGAGKDQGVEYRLRAARLDFLGVGEVIVGLVSVVGLHTPRDVLNQPHLLGRRGLYVHRLPQSRSCERVRDHRVARDARRLAFTGLELLGLGEPDVHSFVEILRRALAIPPTRLDWDILRSHLASAQNHQDRDHDEGYAPPHSGLAHDATAFFFSGRCLRTTILQFAAEPA